MTLMLYLLDESNLKQYLNISSISPLSTQNVADNDRLANDTDVIVSTIIPAFSSKNLSINSSP
jgi:hypothetical protein